VSVRLEVSATPDRIGPEDQVTIRVAAVNEGSDTIDPQVRASRLLIDGQPSMTWSLAISNGAGDMRETALPPGERVEAARQFGASLFRSPGEHELVAEAGGVRSDPATITVADG
jgi:hypothetical protein